MATHHCIPCAFCTTKCSICSNCDHVFAGQVSGYQSFVVNESYSPAGDTLQKMYQSQIDFMKLLQEKRGFPEFPVDLTTKVGQQLLREITHSMQDELAEANILLKNAKSHRIADIKEFDRASYVEELVDAFKFFLENLIVAGISIEEFTKSFEEKTKKNKERINGDY